MALSPSILSAAIVAAWTSDPRCGFSSPLRADQAEMVKALADAVAGAVVAHLQSAAVVVVSSVSGVMTGPGVSGPGVGRVT